MKLNEIDQMSDALAAEWFKRNSYVGRHGQDRLIDFLGHLKAGMQTDEFTLSLTGKGREQVLKLPLKVEVVRDLEINYFAVNDFAQLPRCKTFAVDACYMADGLVDYILEKVEGKAEISRTKMKLDDLISVITADKAIDYFARAGGSTYLNIRFLGGVLELYVDNVTKGMVVFDTVFDLQSFLIDHDLDNDKWFAV